MPPVPSIFKRTIRTSFGQPLPQTHPHLFTSKQELTPGITAQEYRSRRDRLAAKLSDGDLAIVAGSTVQWRSSSVFYPFYQNSNFAYISGFLESEALIALERSDRYSKGYKYHLFARAKDTEEEKWQGSRSGNYACIEVFGADTSIDIAKMASPLNQLIRTAQNIYIDLFPSSSKTLFTTQNTSSLQNVVDVLLTDKQVRPLSPVLHAMRAFKSTAEIECLKKAGAATAKGFSCVMSQQFDTESALWSCFEHEIRRNGCHSDGYVPVVAGGENALVLHYVANNSILGHDDLILLDGGGQYGGYTADVSRTWPVKGKFTPPQKDLVSAVLQVEKKCIELCSQSAGLSLDDIHHRSNEFLYSELKNIGFDFRHYNLKEIYPHHVGHYVGLDVHDCDKFPRSRHLQASQVVTIEPGVYIPNDDRFPKHFRGVGIRIEDSVLVGKHSPTVLTDAPKEIRAIENLGSS